MKTYVSISVALVAALVHCGASAGELRVAAGGDGAVSSWDDDKVGHTMLKAGWTFTDYVAATFTSKLGYGSIDERMLSHFALGAELYRELGPWRPYVRADLVHQHEEPRAAIEADPLGAAFGVGDGIRHRGGASAGLGVAVTLSDVRGVPLFVAADFGGTWLSNEAGPRSYWTGGLSLGFAWQLGGSRAN